MFLRFWKFWLLFFLAAAVFVRVVFFAAAVLFAASAALLSAAAFTSSANTLTVLFFVPALAAPFNCFPYLLTRFITSSANSVYSFALPAGFFYTLPPEYCCPVPIPLNCPPSVYRFQTNEYPPARAKFP